MTQCQPDLLIELICHYTPHFRTPRTNHDLAYYQSSKFLEVIQEGMMGKFLAIHRLIPERNALLQYFQSPPDSRRPMAMVFPVKTPHFNEQLWAGDLGPNYCQGDPWGLALEYSAGELTNRMNQRVIEDRAMLR